MVSVITTRRRDVQLSKRKLPLKQNISRPPSNKKLKSKATLRREKNDVKKRTCTAAVFLIGHDVCVQTTSETTLKCQFQSQMSDASF